ncbi:MAG: hypothetical protein JRH11_28385, partial [Deltaproteobacteria bacterium]|nr:hypothetical protein [Deltaproteobacteria bacterium]
MNGLQFCFWTGDDESLYLDDRSVPLGKPAVEGPLTWGVPSDPYGSLWGKIEGNKAPAFYTGLVAIPDIETIFTTDWDGILCMEEGTFLFDAFHHYRGVYLRLDRETRS